jgi:pimeloyl-ACP methyl ester carboxylesterase
MTKDRLGVARAKFLHGGTLAATVAIAALLGGLATGTGAERRAVSASFTPAECPQGIPPNVKDPQCGYLTVSQNHSNPSSGEVRLTVVRIPAVTSNPGALPIVYLHGGPGGNELASTGDLVEFGINRDHEVIALSQRGTYGSSPFMPCRSIDNFRANSLDLRLYAKSTGRKLANAASRCRRTLVKKGIDLSAFNTLENAADVEDLRKALGIAKWNVFGHSYGTDLVLTYMRLYPEGIRTVVLDGTVPPPVASIGWTWPSVREFFDNLLRACRAQPSCRQQYPHTGRTYIRLVNRLQKHPITTKAPVPGSKRRAKVKIDGGVLVNWLTRQSHFAATVPREIDQLAHGHPKPVAKAWAEARALPEEHRGNFAHGMSYSVWCSEWIPYESVKQQLRMAKKAFPGFPPSVLAQGPQLTFLRNICRRWNVPTAPSSVRDVTHSTIPTLAITGTFDAQTGAQWGAFAASTISPSTVVEVPGVSHAAYANPCAADVINSFWESPLAPDTSCVAHVKPPHFVTGHG